MAAAPQPADPAATWLASEGISGDPETDAWAGIPLALLAPASAVTEASSSVEAEPARTASRSAVALDASCRKLMTASLASTATSAGPCWVFAGLGMRSPRASPSMELFDNYT